MDSKQIYGKPVDDLILTIISTLEKKRTLDVSLGQYDSHTVSQSLNADISRKDVIFPFINSPEKIYS